MAKCKCPKCGNQLFFEEFGQYGRIHKVGLNGKIQKRFERADYGGDDVISSMVYCRQCGWTASSFVLSGNAVSMLKGD